MELVPSFQILIFLIMKGAQIMEPMAQIRTTIEQANAMEKIQISYVEQPT